ncbi:TPA: phosphotransferase family protein [Enterobacter soli]|jgi:aminoglycoside phosphotransferase (APT) family kinase protein
MPNQLSSSQLEKIPDVIKYATGKETISFEHIPIGVMNYKILCITESDEKYIIRIYPHGREGILKKELQIINRCSQIGIPVPNILTTSLSGPNIGFNYLVYPKIEGMMLSSYLNEIENPKIDYIGHQLLNIFKKISSLKIKNYGDLENGFNAYYTEWDRFVTESIKNGRDGLYKSNIIPRNIFLKVEDFITSKLNNNIKPESCLIWGDTSIDNILVNRTGEISGIIDFESCLSGPSNCTIGYFIDTLNPKLKTHELLAGYLLDKSKVDNDEIYSFSLLRAYRLAEFISIPLPTGRQRDMLIDIFPGLKWVSDFLINTTGSEK